VAIKISIIIPAYNVENYIEECLETLLKQTMTEYEIICVDDASSDNTSERIHRYSERYDNIICIKNEENKGAAFSRNRGLFLAKGEYVIFLDSDDTYHPQLLEKLYYAISNECADVAICNFEACDESGKVINQGGWHKDMFRKHVLTVQDNRELLFNGIAWIPWNKLVRRQFLLDNNIQFQNLKNANDVFYSMMVVACAEKITFVPEILVNYRSERQGNITQYRIQKKDYAICAFEKVITQLKNMGIWDGDIKKSGISTVFAKCYSLVTTSDEERAQYYLDEWRLRIALLLSENEVKQTGYVWIYYQYLFLNGRVKWHENIYCLCHKEIVEYLEEHSSDTIVLWGAGEKGKKLFSSISNIEEYIDYIVDNDVKKQGTLWNGIEICSFEMVRDKADKYLVLNEYYIEDIIQQVGMPEKVVNMESVLGRNQL